MKDEKELSSRPREALAAVRAAMAALGGPEKAIPALKKRVD